MNRDDATVAIDRMLDLGVSLKGDPIISFVSAIYGIRSGSRQIFDEDHMYGYGCLSAAGNRNGNGMGLAIDDHCPREDGVGSGEGDGLDGDCGDGYCRGVGYGENCGYGTGSGIGLGNSYDIIGIFCTGDGFGSGSGIFDE